MVASLICSIRLDKNVDGGRWWMCFDGKVFGVCFDGGRGKCVCDGSAGAWVCVCDWRIQGVCAGACDGGREGVGQCVLSTQVPPAARALCAAAPQAACPFRRLGPAVIVFEDLCGAHPHLPHTCAGGEGLHGGEVPQVSISITHLAHDHRKSPSASPPLTNISITHHQPRPTSSSSLTINHDHLKPPSAVSPPATNTATATTTKHRHHHHHHHDRTATQQKVYGATAGSSQR